MKNYILYHNQVHIQNNNGSMLKIYFNELSGQSYFRNKIDSLSNIKHSGIFLGLDKWGVGYFIHNHYNVGKAIVVTSDEFAVGKPLGIYHEVCANDPLTVIKIGLDQVLKAKPYHFLFNNCQTLANYACNNEMISEDVTKWKNILLLGSLALGVSLLFESREN